MEKYEHVAQVGEGTYGKVYKARMIGENEQFVAMKKIRMETEKEGFPVTSAREIKLLKLLDHENIIKIIDIVSSKDGVSLVFDYFEHDLSGLLQHPGTILEVSQIKYIMKCLLLALEHMHKRRIIHRDLKTSNILIGASGEIKLADFGLAKSLLHPDLPEPSKGSSSECTRIMTNRVVTIWYRPPELLLGSTDYSAEVDMWGVGCILVELFTQKPLFAGVDNTEISQIEAVLKRYSSIEAEALKSCPWSSLLDLSKIEPEEPLLPTFLKQQHLPEDARDLAIGLLQLNPSKRLTASEALRHQFFKNSPKPSSRLPSLDGDWHEFECKQRRKDSRGPSKISSAK